MNNSGNPNDTKYFRLNNKSNNNDNGYNQYEGIEELFKQKDFEK